MLNQYTAAKAKTFQGNKYHDAADEQKNWRHLIHVKLVCVAYFDTALDANQFIDVEIRKPLRM